MKNIKFQTESAAEEFCRRLNAVGDKVVYGHSSDSSAFWLSRPTHPAGEGHWWIQKTVSPGAKVHRYDGAYLVKYREEFEQEANDVRKVEVVA